MGIEIIALKFIYCGLWLLSPIGFRLNWAGLAWFNMQMTNVELYVNSMKKRSLEVNYAKRLLKTRFIS